MGCASSAPLAGEGGPLGDIKSAANEMVESGEKAVNEMGNAAAKTATEAVETVKEVISSAAQEVQEVASNIGGAAADAMHSMTDKVKEEVTSSKEKAEEKAEDLNATIEDIMSTPTRKAEEKFVPTPVPSFENPPTPNTVLEAPPPLAKIEEASMDDMMKETAGVAEEPPEAPMSPEEAAEVADTVPNELDDLRMTKWEALADAIVELPPKMCMDLNTGQIYAVVEDDPPSKKNYKSALIKKLPSEATLNLLSPSS